MLSPSYQGHCCEHSEESFGSNRATIACPSVRNDSASSGSRHALRCSSARRRSCTPSRESNRTPAIGAQYRVGALIAYSLNRIDQKSDLYGVSWFWRVRQIVIEKPYSMIDRQRLCELMVSAIPHQKDEQLVTPQTIFGNTQSLRVRTSFILMKQLISQNVAQVEKVSALLVT